MLFWVLGLGLQGFRLSGLGCAVLGLGLQGFRLSGLPCAVLGFGV